LADNPILADRPVFRFAPSPNGLLHLGHAFSALVNLRMAREAGGIVLLRIEDIDIERCTPAYERRMLADLEWIGFEWDEEPLRQSLRFERYGAVLEALVDEQLVYPAAMSRRQVRDKIEKIADEGGGWPCDPDGVPHYPGEERNLPPAQRQAILASNTEYALRLDMGAAMECAGGALGWREYGSGPAGENGEIAADPAQWGDVVLGRKLTPASYHLACVFDDAEQGVTDVVRGRDLFHATSVHRLLQEILRLPVPAYCHHDLILDETGSKLSKSTAGVTLADLREAGLTPLDIRRMVGL
jgi:glutamyl-Q tRNA(Asp) synthetase